MTRPLWHLITVGVSLFDTKDKRSDQPYAEYQSLVPILKRLVEPDRARVKDIVLGYGAKRLRIALAAIDGAAEIDRRTHGTQDGLPQELSCLYLTYKDCDYIPGPQDRVTLLYSQTNEGLAVALLLQDYLQRESASRHLMFGEGCVEIRQIDDLNPELDQMGPRALESLARHVREVLVQTGYGRTYEILFNFTGGFKGMIPYAQQIANLHPEIQLRYLFERSTEIGETASLPIAFDAARWREWKGLVRAADNTADDTARRNLVSSFPGVLQTLFDKDAKMGPLGRMLQNRYEREARGDLLSLYGPGEQLLDLILDEDLKLAARKAMPLWRHADTGDKVPEMVDHGRGHFQRVQELMVQVLHPLKGADVFNPHEVLALTAATWLHDAGHAAEFLDFDVLSKSFPGLVELNGDLQLQKVPLAGFPSLTRDFHHLLSPCLVLDPVTRPAYLPDEPAFWTDERIKSFLWVCLYHRRSMPLGDGSEPYLGGKPLGFKISRPCEESVSVGGIQVRCRALAALYSLCDGCDIQRDRSVPEDQLHSRRHALARVVEGLLDRLDQFDNKTLKFPGVSRASRLMKALRGPILKYCRLGSNPGGPGDATDVKRAGKFLDCADETISIAVKRFARLHNGRIQAPESARETAFLSTLDRLQFTARQSGFYEHHRALDAVYFLYHGETDENGRKLHQFSIHADYSGDKEKARKAFLGGGPGKEGGIAGEVLRSAPVLKEVLGIVVKAPVEADLKCLGGP